MKPYPKSYLQFIALFNSEQFWESHEVLEAPWRINGSPFYKGLIIFASVFVHVQRGNPVGVWKQSEKCVKYLQPYAPHYMGLDVGAIVSKAQQCYALAKENPDVKGPDLGRLISFYRLRLHDDSLHGDEAEFVGEEDHIEKTD